MFTIKDVADDEFVKLDDSRKIIRHRRINLLLLITLSMCGYFTYGWANDMLELSNQLEAEQTIYTRKDDPEVLDLRGSRSSYRSSGGKKHEGGFIVGIIIIWIGIPMVWMNERRDVKTY